MNQAGDNHYFMNKNATILIIDDEVVSRYTIEALLDSDGYTLVFAEDGEEGLEKAAGIIPDLILLDVMMPGITGFEVCRRLRLNNRLKNVPIIMVTAWDDATAKQRCINMGANAVICKPFNYEKLSNQLQYFIKKNTP